MRYMQCARIMFWVNISCNELTLGSIGDRVLVLAASLLSVFFRRVEANIPTVMTDRISTAQNVRFCIRIEIPAGVLKIMCETRLRASLSATH